MIDEFVPLRKNNKNKSIFLFLTIILSLGVSLAAVYYIYHYKDSRENQIASGLISLTFSDSNSVININTRPVLDEVGLSNTPYNFTITNTSSVPVNSKILLEIDDDTDIDLGAVKYALYINNNLVKKDYIREDDMIGESDVLLYKYSNMSSSQAINCRLVFWVDYYYDEPSVSFIAKVKAEGESVDIIVPNP